MNAQMATQGSEPVSIGDWIITYIVLCIPIVGLIMLFVWGFSSSTKPSKKNFCLAGLIIAAIMIVLYIVLFFLFGAALMGMAHHSGGATL